MQEHGTPTSTQDKAIGSYIQFQTAVLRQLPRPHQTSQMLLHHWLQNQAELRRVLLEVLVSRVELPNLDLDTPLHKIFTRELCSVQLGFSEPAMSRLFTMCSGWGDFEKQGDEYVHVRRPIDTIRKLVSKTEHELRRVPNVGNVTINILKTVLGSFGLRLGMQLPSEET